MLRQSPHCHSVCDNVYCSLTMFSALAAVCTVDRVIEIVLITRVSTHLSETVWAYVGVSKTIWERLGFVALEPGWPFWNTIYALQSRLWSLQVKRYEQNRALRSKNGYWGHVFEVTEGRRKWQSSIGYLWLALNVPCSILAYFVPFPR